MPDSDAREIPEYFAEEVTQVHFMGANTMIVFSRIPRGAVQAKTVCATILPTGSIPAVLRQLSAFAIEHRLPVPDHIAP